MAALTGLATTRAEPAVDAVAALRAADPGPWHRAAAAWSVLADRLARVQSGLDGDALGLRAAWLAGLGAVPARARLGQARAEVLAAAAPVRRVAAALEEHAYALAALRRIAHLDLSEPERTELLARHRALDERTSAVLLASRPPTEAPKRRGGPRVGATTWWGQHSAVGVRRGGDPEAVAAWWRSLAPSQRDRLLGERPEAIGWLDGVSAADRDRANRMVLAAAIAELDTREAELARRLDRLAAPALLAPLIVGPAEVGLATELSRVRSRLGGLLAVRSSLQSYPREALLLGIDAGSGSREPRVVVALGDPDHARHTVVFVPGVNSDLGDTAGGVDRVAALWRAADAMTATAGDISAVYWLGYDAPQTEEALSYGPSAAGAARLAPFLDGLRAAHDPAASHVTLVGHSYGTTVVADAALRGGLPVDDIVAVGSPGMHTPHAADLNLDPRHVWGGLAADDPIGGALGELWFVHGQEPTDPDFGGNQFVVDTRGHGGYWNPGSQSLRNQAAIVVGRYDLVGYVRGRAPAW